MMTFVMDILEKKDCAMFSDLKRIVKDCSDKGGYIEWY